VYGQSTIAAVEQKTKNKIPGVRFRVEQKTKNKIPGVRFRVGTEAKTKFPESASALIHNQKQNSRSLLPR